MRNMRRLRGYKDMSEIVIDSKEIREYFENLEVYRLAAAMTAIFRHKGNCHVLSRLFLNFP